MALLKWIRCAVNDPAGFHAGQSGWGELGSSPGFRGQWGGWNDTEAYLIALWVDLPFYRSFMAGPHDRLAAAQAGTYDWIDVRLFEALDTTGDPARAGLLRLAHCRVTADQVPDFVRAQRTIWTPGMAAAPGFTGCVFGVRDDTEFLIVSGWATTADHDDYRRDRFPDLDRRSGAAGHLTAIDSHLIIPERDWTVCPEAPAAGR